MTHSTRRNAVELAEEEHCDKISRNALEKQRSDARDAMHDFILRSLTEDCKILYCKAEGQILSRNLWQEYLQHCEQFERKTLAPENLH